MFTSMLELENGLDFIQHAPRDKGTVEAIVCRPAVDERRELDQGIFDIMQGLVGDSWLERERNMTTNGTANTDTQLTLMNARVIALVAQTRDRWQLAGDQLYVDLDLSFDNLPPGTRLTLGNVLIETTAEPHLGCRKFYDRFGKDATVFVNSDTGKKMNLRGINAKVIESGAVTRGSVIAKLSCK